MCDPPFFVSSVYPRLKTAKTSVVQSGSMWLIIDAYKTATEEPAEVKEETADWIPPETNRIRELLEETYIIDPTNHSENNWTSTRELNEYLQDKGLNYSEQKVGRELVKLGLEKTSKKIGGKTIRVWIGVTS